MRRRVSRSLVVMLCSCLIGCSSDKQTEEVAKTRTVEDAAPILADSAGTPVAAGYIDGLLTIQTGPDPTQQEGIVASEANKFLLVVTLNVSEGSQKFAAGDYRVRVADNSFSPIAVSFGGRKQLFFSVDQFLAELIDIKHDPAGSVGLKDDRLSEVHLPEPEIVLLYKVDGSDEIELVHGQQATELSVADATETFLGSADPVAAVDQPLNSELQVELVEGGLKVGTLLDERAEVYELTLKVRCPDQGVVFDARDLYLDGGSKRSRQFYFEYDEQDMRMLAGSSYVRETYNDTPVVRIDAGGLRLGLNGGSIELHCIFPQPPFETGLKLQFPGHVPIELIPANEALGEIRPAFAEDTIRVPRAPLIGKPIKVSYLEGELPYLVPGRRGETEPTVAPAGQRFVMLKFELAEGKQRFIANDYELVTTENSKTRPMFIAPGTSPAEQVPEDKYQAIGIEPGEQDGIRRSGGALAAWVVASRDFIMIFDVPVDDSSFTFKHGSTQLTLQPSKVPRTWAEFRPPTAINTLAGVGRPQPGSTPKNPDPDPEPDAKAAAENARKAAATLKLAQNLADKNPQAAREYAERALKLVPADSETAKRAAALLKTLDE